MPASASTRTYVSPVGAAQDAALSYVLYLHRSFLRWVYYVMFAPIYALLIVGAAELVGEQPAATTIWFIALVAACGAIIAMNVWPYLTMRRTAGSAYGPGATYESGWDDDTFWVRGPDGSEGRVPYSTIKRVARKRDWVFLEPVAASVVGIYAAEMLPDDVEQRVSGARRSSEPSRGGPGTNASPEAR